MKPISIPKVADHLDSKAQELEARFNDLTTRLSALEKEKTDFVLSGAQPHATLPDNTRLAELLGEPPPPIVVERREQLAKYAEDIRILRQARDRVGGQIRVERVRAESAVRAAASPEYRRRIRVVCDAFLKLHEANVQFRQLTNALEDDGIPWEGLGVVAPKAVGHPSDPYSPAGLYLKDAADQGFIEKSEIPKELRQ